MAAARPSSANIYTIPPSKSIRTSRVTISSAAQLPSVRRQLDLCAKAAKTQCESTATEIGELDDHAREIARAPAAERHLERAQRHLAVDHPVRGRQLPGGRPGQQVDLDPGVLAQLGAEPAEHQPSPVARRQL